jgi:hypothetical protein
MDTEENLFYNTSLPFVLPRAYRQGAFNHHDGERKL